MSMTSTEQIELTADHQRPDVILSEPANSIHNVEDDAPRSAVESIPDGGYGWIIALACSTVTFTINGWTGCWGIIQTAILEAGMGQGSTTSLSFVGSLSIALCAVLGLASVRLSQSIGTRYSMLLGVLLMGFGILFSSFTVNNLGGLFVAPGVLFGLGASLTYTVSNSLPVQWFSSKLGTANGLIKLGGGLGATIMAIVAQALIDNVGIPWALRILASISLAIGVPAAWLCRDRVPPNRAASFDLSLFKSKPFSCLCLAGATGTFALFVPPFFLPLFAHSIGLPASTGAGTVAAFNACGAIGRLCSGFGCDKFGSTNMLLLTVALNAVNMLAIWPVSDTIGPLLAFAALNGFANGAFFVAMPTAVGRIVGPGQAAVGMGMAITGWTGGYLMGSPIAGMLIAQTGADKAHSIEPYKAAIFYAGGIATASAAFVLLARFNLDTKLIKKL